MKKIKKGFIALLLIGSLSCVKDSDFAVPIIECVSPEITVTNTIQQVKEMYTFGGATLIENDVVIEGYVNSSDASGNIYKSISIQDKPENPTAAIKISIDETDIYTKYNIGRKIAVKLKGLAVGYSYGSIQIGKIENTGLGRIPRTELDNYIVRTCEVAEMVPKQITIEELNEGHLEMLVQLNNVQFNQAELGNSFANVDNTETVDRILEQFTADCSLLNTIKLRNSGYSSFKNELLPEGNGSVVAVLSNYYEDYQLYIRGVEDVLFNDTRCDYSKMTPTHSLTEIKELYTNSLFEFGVTAEYIVEGYVVSSDQEGNMTNKLIIQDAAENPTAGIQLLIDKEQISESFQIGSKVLVKLNKLYMNKQNNVLVIGFPKDSKVEEIAKGELHNYIYKTDEAAEIIPQEIEIKDAFNSKYENTLVKLVNVQLVEDELGKAFTFFSGTESAGRTIETCGEINKVSVFTNGKATFANEAFPEGKGAIKGVLNGVLEIRTKSDVSFNESFEKCPVIIPKIMITEIADPQNSTGSRFVELYNAGETAISLTGWKLNKYVNGSSTVSGGAILLDGFVMESESFLIIANTGFSTIFNIIPAIESTYISGNGDDVYELVDGSGNTIDIFGVIGEDGNGTNWEYLDGGAVRKIAINSPNISFDINEWKIYSNANNFLISNPNSPKIAPNDFSPNYR